MHVVREKMMMMPELSLTLVAGREKYL